MQKTMFAAINLLHNTDLDVHNLIASNADGQLLFNFELSREVAGEIADHMNLQIMKVKNQKPWQDAEEVQEEKKAVSLQ